MAVEITEEDISASEAFLTKFLTENVPEGRFSEGSALRDLTVKALAFIVAHIRRENRQIQNLQSLLNAPALADGDPDTDRAVASAVDAILSNWFLTRNTGSFARGTLFIQVTKNQDYVIPINNRFLYDRNRAFFLDVEDTSQDNLVIPSSSVVPNLTASGEVESYTFKVRVIAARTGSEFNVEPAVWSSVGSFSPFIVGAFNDVVFSGGGNRESTTEAVDRAQNAVSVRNLINPRSVDATLRDRFSNLKRVLTVGMGEPEMQRDLKENLVTNTELHLGGYFDIYCDLPVTERTFEGQVGGRFARPDNVANVFRDSTVADWTATDVRVGDIIRIADGLEDAPRDFTIKEMYPHELRISAGIPFSEATEDSGSFVDYFIYRPVFGPDVRIRPTTGTVSTGETSRFVQTDNRVLLPGGAHYDVLDVAVVDPDSGDAFIDPGDGFVHFPNRTNNTPVAATSSEHLEFQVLSKEPLRAQSQISFEELIVEPKYNGKTLQVTYDTLAGLDVVHSFTRDRFEKVSAANPLARGFFPVYLSFTVPYKLRQTATAFIDEEALKQALADYINGFDPRSIIDVSDVTQQVRNFDSNIGAVFPFNIFFDLIAPDGTIISYETEDEVIVKEDKLSPDSDVLSNPLSVSLSERTIKYLTTVDRLDVSING